ncbi:unnamed protein product [Alopecurus aequalis]
MATEQRNLAGDLLLEIVARSDTRALVCCAAACKRLRRRILNPSFICRVTQQGGIIPPCILVHLNTHDEKGDPPPPFSLVHPATPATVSFLDRHLSSYMSRFVGDIFKEHYPVRDVVVLHGGVIHWMVRHRGLIVTYNVCTTEYGTIKLPRHITDFKGHVHLEAHGGRKQLFLVGTEGFNISVWHQLPNGDWPSEAVTIDTEEKLRSLDPDIGPEPPFFRRAGAGSNVELLRINCYGSGLSKSFSALLLVLDLETMGIRVLQESTASSMLLEIDLPSRLRAMKTYPSKILLHPS